MMPKELLSGNEAIGRGALEAGISLAISYPGTPATEILEYLAQNFSGDAQWALNEKVALETAIGTSYAGKRALCSMKHVGLNVASDPLMTSAYLGIKGGLVLAVADDPGAYSSQNEQDSRYYAEFAKIPCLEPSDSQEAKDMTIMAFNLSEEMGLPVMVRTVTRISHALSPVKIGAIRKENPLKLEKDPERLLAIPSNVIRCHRILNEKQVKLQKWTDRSKLNRAFKDKQKKGIIACGIGYAYAREYGPDFALLKISAYPFSENLIADFTKGLKEIWVLEEGEPMVEKIARKYSARVRGKISGEISPEGELGPDILAEYVPSWRRKEKKVIIMKDRLPTRTPVMCPGCPHRELYKSLKKAGPHFTTGDIGCYTLGASPPLSAMDTCLCMGASISKAAGIAKQGVQRVAAVIGDSTFLHSGIPALISAVYNQADILVLILDNSSIAMTGHQPTPLTGISAKGKEGNRVSLEEICLSCGVRSVEVIDPFDSGRTEKIIREKLDAEGVNVIISRRPCILAAKQSNKPDSSVRFASE
ncbi:MAG: thiamine pyrophosphate-dependent enzyme [Candidatus Omnitrophota bacterium]